MTSPSAGYANALTAELGRGWNQFWFAPSDPVSLGALRVAVGLIALYMTAAFTPDLQRYFGPHGLVPVEMLTSLEEQTRDGARQLLPGQVREAMPRQYRFSYFDSLRSPRALLTAHAAGMAVLALFTLGLCTRISAVGSMVVVLSYLHRGPMLASGVEPLLAMLIFYLCLGPSGAAWSLDRWLAARRSASRATRPTSAEAPVSPWATVALRLIQVHLTLIYAMMAVGKLGNNDWWGGLGIWWLIARTESRMMDLSGLHRFPLLINAWCYAVLLWQTVFPILIWNRLARPLLLAVNLAMWILLAPVMGNLPLALTMAAASLAFVSPAALRKLTHT